jgi:WD40 repeat protein
LVISGGKDTIIEVRDPKKLPEANAEAMLLGHEGNICSLDVSPSGNLIVSGSWDCTARIWKVGNWESSVVLEGHSASVWAAIALDDNTIVTGMTFGLGLVMCIDKCYRVSGQDDPHLQLQRQLDQGDPRSIRCCSSSV